jgi:hypothetical protein
MHSPLSALKRQADRIALLLKAAERGEAIHGGQLAVKIKDARAKPNLKVGIFMDDKLITIDMPWSTIRNTSEVGLAAYILKQMRAGNDVLQ